MPFKQNPSAPLAMPPVTLGSNRRFGPSTNRRGDNSPIENASAALSHAVEHLLSEQLAGLRPDLDANREAINLLCSAIRTLASLERRSRPRDHTAAWLRTPHLNRARRSLQITA